MTNQTSPFAPIDIPDVNSIPAPSAMPPMSAMPPVGNDNISMADIPEPAIQPESGTPAGSPAMQDAGAPQTSATMSLPPMPAVPKMPGLPEEPKAMAQNSQSVPTPASTQKEDTQKPIQNKTAPKPVNTPVAKATVQQKNTQGGASPAKVAQPQPAVRDVEVATANAVQMPTKKSSVTIEPLLEECIRQNASDLHLQAGLPPILRIDGALRPIASYPVFDNATVQELVFSTLDADQKVILMKDKEFDYSFAFGDLGRFRVNAFQEKGNMAAAFRLIPNVIKTLKISRIIRMAWC